MSMGVPGGLSGLTPKASAAMKPVVAIVPFRSFIAAAHAGAECGDRCWASRRLSRWGWVGGESTLE